MSGGVLLSLNLTSATAPKEESTYECGLIPAAAIQELSKLEALGKENHRKGIRGDCLQFNCPQPCRYHKHSSYSPGYEFECTYDDLNESISEGCLLCQLFKAVVDKICKCRFRSAKPKTSVPHSCIDLNCRYLNGAVYGLHVRWQCGRDWLALGRYEGMLPTQVPHLRRIELTIGEDATALSLRVISSAINQDPLGKQAVSMYRRWLDNCLTFHAECSGAVSNILPRRLLDINHLPDCIRVTETNGKDARYAAFSYCWGARHPPKALQANLAKLQVGIPLRELPRSFIDLIALLRALEIHYVWIDSLCILQDNVEDWETESSRMGDIYRNAVITIIAANSANPDVGFLASRAYGLWTEAVVKDDASQELHYYYREHPRHPGNRDATSGCAIVKRAWCYQERLMAPRKLIFGPHEAIWECKNGCHCEDMGSDPIGAATGTPNPPYVPSPLPQPGAAVFDTAAKAYEIWRDNVEIFSFRKLTVATDRFPAITSLASIIAKFTKDRYLAGLWEGDLLHGLMWGVGSDAIPELFDDYVAPTWSWAYLRSEVIYDYVNKLAFGEEHTPVAPFKRCGLTLVEAYCKIDGLNPFGAVQHGFLRLQAFYCDVELELCEGSYLEIEGYRTDLDVPGLKLSIAPDTQDIFDMMTVHPFTMPSYDHKPNNDGSCCKHNPRTVTTLQRSRDPEQTACTGQCRLLWLMEECCLILTQSQHHVHAYERLGILQYRPTKPGRTNSPWLVSYISMPLLKDYGIEMQYGEIKLV